MSANVVDGSIGTYLDWQLATAAASGGPVSLENLIAAHGTCHIRKLASSSLYLTWTKLHASGPKLPANLGYWSSQQQLEPALNSQVRDGFFGNFRSHLTQN